MSMYRQLWLAIILSMLLALGGSLFASIFSARSYLQSQLSIKNNDTALALALSLSQSHPDPVSVELTVSALFDSGHYELIRIVDPHGKPVVERSSPPDDLDAPTWFVRWLPIHATPGEAKITDGWQQFGTVTLISHSRFAYGALWSSALEMTLALTLAGAIGGVLGSLILGRLRRPINSVIGQAVAITERRFSTIEEPDVPELKQLASAMNTMVGRLKTMFEEEAARLDSVRREANCDSLTGLANREHFMARLREHTQNDESAGGVLFIARLANLSEINRTVGRSVTDDLLRHCGAVVSDFAADIPGALTARLNGADFALLVPHLAEPDEAAETLLQRLCGEAANFGNTQTMIGLGCGHFDRGLEPDAILAQVDAALAKVEMEKRSGLHFVNLRKGDVIAKNASEWSRMILNSLQQGWARLVSFPVKTLDGELLHFECPLRLKFLEAGEWQVAGDFLPAAERLHLTAKLDFVALDLGLAALNAHPDLPGIAINLSASSFEHPDFRNRLLSLVKNRKEAKRLWLDVSEAGALNHFDTFRALCHELSGTGCQIGIEHAGHRISEIGRLHGLGLDYLKVDASFVRDLGDNAGNQTFLGGLTSIAHSIGMKVIAEGVSSEAELRALGNLNFDGVTGPAVKDSQ